MEEVRKLLGMEEALEVQREAFIALAEGHTVTAPNSWLRLPEGRRGWLKLLAGHDATSAGLGVKVLARFPQNPSGANLGSLIMLFDDGNGFPLAIMDGVYVTAARTGAGAGLATEALARPEASSIGLVGTGVVAWFSLQAMVLVRPRLSALRVYSRSESRREEFAERARERLGLDATPVATVDESTQGADVVVTATNSAEPVVYARHLEPGQHVNAMGIRTELAPDVMRRCSVVGDGREEAIKDGKFSVALEAGMVSEGELGPDLGQVLAGLAPGRSDTGQITLFDSSGVAIQDVASARYVWERAEQSNLGTLVDLGLGGRLY
jgi:ornithine cyclodeaminase/alanine dehydrogenase-like protein (mu-crystallin family)